jgi:hypothetical protein
VRQQAIAFPGQTSPAPRSKWIGSVLDFGPRKGTKDGNPKLKHIKCWAASEEEARTTLDAKRLAAGYALGGLKSVYKDEEN